MNTAFKSIAILGLKNSGKETICNLIGEKLPKHYYAQSADTFRYMINLEDFPGLKGSILTIYSDLGNLNLDMSEKEGVIVLTPKQMDSFCDYQPFRWHKNFFELLQKLCWLGVNHYTVAVTHIDEQEKTGITAWFEKISQKFSNILKDHFGSIVNAYVPVGRKIEGKRYNWFNIRKREPDLLKWYSGPCLAEALEDLVSIPRANSDSLWAVGRAIPTDNKSELCLITERISRGTIVEDYPVRIYLDEPDDPDGLPGILKSDVSPESFKSCPELAIKIYDKRIKALQKASSVIFVSSTSTAQSRAIVGIDALLASSMSQSEFLDHTPTFEMIFFGAQKRRGEVIRFKTREHHFNYSLAQRAHLEIYILSKAVLETFLKDSDAGRVIIWRQGPTKSQRTLAGVGKIVAFYDYEINRLIDEMMQIDQLRFEEIGEKSLLTSLLVDLYHDKAKNRAEMLLLDVKRSMNSTQIVESSCHIRRKINTDFEKIISKVQSLYTYPVFEKYANLINAVCRHLADVKKDLVDPYNDLILQLEAHNNKVEFIELTLKRMIGHYNDRIKLINKRTTQTINYLIKEVLTSCKEGLNFYSEIHNQLQKDLEYYPRNNSVQGVLLKDVELYSLDQTVEEVVTDALEEVIINSVKHSGRLQDLRFDIFIDPPSIQEPSTVLIWFQDNGILTDEILYKIRSSEGGWSRHRRKLEEYNIKLDISDLSVTFGTTFIIKIPVWYSRRRNLEDIAFKLGIILSYVDYEKQEQNGICPDFLGRLLNILKTAENREMVDSNLGRLRCEIKQDEGILTNHPLWIQEAISRLDEIIQALEFETSEEIRRAICLVEELREHPVIEMIHHARRELSKGALGKIDYLNGFYAKENLIRITQASLPPYRLLYPALHFLIRDTFAWAFREFLFEPTVSSNILVRLQMSENGDKILVFLSGSGMNKSSEVLLPVMTRLANLRINTELRKQNTENMLILCIPIWKVYK